MLSTPCEETGNIGAHMEKECEPHRRCRPGESEKLLRLMRPCSTNGTSGDTRRKNCWRRFAESPRKRRHQKGSDKNPELLVISRTGRVMCPREPVQAVPSKRGEVLSKPFPCARRNPALNPTTLARFGLGICRDCGTACATYRLMLPSGSDPKDSFVSWKILHHQQDS